MENLQDFMLLFRMQPNDQQPTSDQISEMQKKWGAFIGGIAAQAKLLSTTRLAFEGVLIDNKLNVSTGITIADNETLSGNMVIKATTFKEATKIAKGCPILSMGGSVEVRGIIPMEA
ncbi:YciI family protein [uncultured Zobellia sp.]|uniref:YciI family protein n=1 Tax=uncultured Zobellia sp. TaxID=255433 RepID=UPI00259221D1|nr:YciI family protein [uncultured Zobellia sp.]